MHFPLFCSSIPLDTPRVKTSKSILNTNASDNAELHCEYDSSTESRVTWWKDGKVLDTKKDPAAKYFNKNSEAKGSKSTSILMVRNVRKADLGDYTCKVSNAVGSQDVNITLTFKPEPPVLQAPIERDGKYTITHWHIRSLLRLTEVMLKYRRKDVRVIHFLFLFFQKYTH